MNHELILPKEYWKKHKYITYAIDVLGHYLILADEKKLVNIEVNLKDEKEGRSLNGVDDIYEWLEANGYHDKALLSFKKHMFFFSIKRF